MNVKRLFIGLLAVFALALLAVACGGDDDDGGGNGDSEIRTQQGLAVAAISGQLATEETGDGSAGTGAPAGRDTSESDRSGSGVDLGFKGVDFAPALQTGQTGITVQGYGSATTDPDSAIVEFYFNRSGGGVEPQPAPDTGSGSSGSSGAIEPAARDAAAAGAAQVAQISEADLQPVIDAIVAAGIPREDIEFIGQTYFDAYYATATLRADVANIDNVDSVVQAAQGAAANLGDIFLSSTNISYTVDDCAALEKAAMDAAVADAKERAAAFAASLGVGLGEVVGASHYSYAPYGGTACDGNFAGPYPLGGIAYAEGARGTVQVFANISVTYGMQ